MKNFIFFCISRQNRQLFFKFEINVCRHSNWKFSEFKNEIVTEKEYRVSECPISWLGKSKKKKIQSRSGNNGWRNKSVAERLSGAYSGILALQWCDDQQTKKKKKKRQKLSHKLQFGCRAQGWMFYVSNGEGAGQDIGGVSCNAKRGKTP